MYMDVVTIFITGEEGIDLRQSVGTTEGLKIGKRRFRNNINITLGYKIQKTQLSMVLGLLNGSKTGCNVNK